MRLLYVVILSLVLVAAGLELGAFTHYSIDHPAQIQASVISLFSPGH